MGTKGTEGGWVLPKRVWRGGKPLAKPGLRVKLHRRTKVHEFAVVQPLTHKNLDI